MLLWRRGTNVLTASTLKVTTDERVQLVNGYNLEISELEPQDAGDYVCQISDKVNRDQTHTVEILGELLILGNSNKSKQNRNTTPDISDIKNVCNRAIK